MSLSGNVNKRITPTLVLSAHPIDDDVLRHQRVAQKTIDLFDTVVDVLRCQGHELVLEVNGDVVFVFSHIKLNTCFGV